jgi:hypothetical protein
MSKSLDQLARNLASGMSRRKAIWQFVSGLGVVAALSGSKAYAGSVDLCNGFCERQADIFREQCLRASSLCGSSCCAEFTPINFNGGGVLAPFICVRVNEA